MDVICKREIFGLQDQRVLPMLCGEKSEGKLGSCKDKAARLIKETEKANRSETISL